MSDAQKKQLHDYLVESREALRWKTEGLSEYDVRRPLTRTGTNLLGLVKHLSIVEASYFGATFDRPFPRHLPWWDDDAPEEADMWATAEEGREEILGTYREATAHADGRSDRSTSMRPATCRGGRVPTSRCTECWSTWSRRPPGTWGTPTSCAS